MDLSLCEETWMLGTVPSGHVRMGLGFEICLIKVNMTENAQILIMRVPIWYENA